MVDNLSLIPRSNSASSNVRNLIKLLYMLSSLVLTASESHWSSLTTSSAVAPSLAKLTPTCRQSPRPPLPRIILHTLQYHLPLKSRCNPPHWSWQVPLGDSTTWYGRCSRNICNSLNPYFITSLACYLIICVCCWYPKTETHVSAWQLAIVKQFRCCHPFVAVGTFYSYSISSQLSDFNLSRSCSIVPLIREGWQMLLDSFVGTSVQGTVQPNLLVCIFHIWRKSYYINYLCAFLPHLDSTTCS